MPEYDAKAFDDERMSDMVDWLNKKVSKGWEYVDTVPIPTSFGTRIMVWVVRWPETGEGA